MESKPGRLNILFLPIAGQIFSIFCYIYFHRLVCLINSPGLLEINALLCKKISERPQKAEAGELGRIAE